MSMVLALSMVLSLTACGGDAKTETQGTSDTKPATDQETKTDASATDSAAGADIAGKTVVFIPKLTGNAFFEAANDGAQKYAADWGITVDYQGSATAGVADQVQVINNAVASGADAICISTVDAAGVKDALQAARDAGLVVCTWDSDATSDARSLMVSQGTPEVLGQMLVDMSVDALKKRGVDPEKDAVKYVWHYSQATVTDQNSWQVAGEKIIAEKYPNWVKVADNYYSEQDAEKAVSVGSAILDAYSDIDLIICNDSTALPGQLKAAQNKGLGRDDITITGFASPQSIKEYCDAKVLYEWGLWDCGIQGAMGCYLAAYLAAGNELKVGDKITIPNIGDCVILANDCLTEGDTTADKNNGVVLLPERVIFDESNVNDYNF
ncbi:MAG: transport system substrate-binding protein [Clostridiales bacterium]|nr:transport system substrate-binding protein [Clostridiales bacterium]